MLSGTLKSLKLTRKLEVCERKEGGQVCASTQGRKSIKSTKQKKKNVEGKVHEQKQKEKWNIKRNLHLYSFISGV